MTAALLLIALILPFAGALIVARIPKPVAEKTAAGIALLTLLASVGAIFTAFPGGFRVEVGGIPWLGETLRHPGGPPRMFGLYLDGLAAVMLLVATIIGFLTVLYSLDYVSERNREHPYREDGRYYFWLLLFLGSMVGVALSPNFLELFIFWELTTLCSWALISYTREERALRAGFRALIVTHFGGLFFIVVLLILFATSFSFGFSALGVLSPSLKGLCVVFLLVAAWTKSAQAPFHVWLPEAMEAPTPVSAYLHAAAMVKAGVYLVARIAVEGLRLQWWTGLLTSLMGALTILMAVSLYMLQDDLKRLLAYSTIAHLGYILVGIGMGVMGSDQALRGAVLHIVCHGFAKATLFLSVGAMAFLAGERRISALAGSAGRFPAIVPISFIVGVLAVTGVPPFSCFWSKLLIFTGALKLGGVIGVALLMFLLAESGFSFAYFVWVAQRLFFTSRVGEGVEVDPQQAPLLGFVLYVLTVMCLVAPILGFPFLGAMGGGR